MELSRTLIREDRNGTKYYAVRCTCGKCGGTGIINVYVPINGGECFDCWGSGVIEYTDKVYTPEYEAKLIARAEKRREKKLAEAKANASTKNAEFFERNGFNSEGKTWFILGNTYSIKDELKSLGCKFDGESKHWYSSKKLEGKECLEVSVDDIYRKDEADTYNWYNKKYDYLKTIEEAENNIRSASSTSKNIGEDGDKIIRLVKHIRTYKSHCYNKYYYNDTDTIYIYTFKDKEGNELVWKTSKEYNFSDSDEITIEGTIKEHKNYKGVDQTILTRCKIS